MNATIKRNPVNCRGYRNVLCPDYSDCLNDAIAKGWEFWECSHCEKRFVQEMDIDIQFAASEPLPFYDLPVEISKQF
jgi:hypothetical protein